MSEKRALQAAARLASSQALWTPALLRMEDIEADPVFLSLGEEGGFRWLDTSDRATALRLSLHIEFEECVDLRREELAEKFGEWPIKGVEPTKAPVGGSIGLISGPAPVGAR